MKQSGIYMLQSISKPERIYIGSAVDLYHRRAQHLYGLRNNKHGNSKLQNHYNKYREIDLVFSILAICDTEELIPVNGVVWLEQFFIWAYDPWFNIAKIAGSQLGTIRSDESRKKISDGHLGHTPWNKGKTGVYSELYIKTWKEHHGNLTRKDCTHTEESKQKMRKPKSEEHRKHMREAQNSGQYKNSGRYKKQLINE